MPIGVKNSHGIITFSSDTKVLVKTCHPIHGIRNNLVILDEAVLKPNINIGFLNLSSETNEKGNEIEFSENDLANLID